MFTADHGTGLGDEDYDAWHYGEQTTDPVHHVPMILAGPGIERRQVIQGAVGQLDVLATALAAMGIEPEASRNWRGRDLRSSPPQDVVSFGRQRIGVRDPTATWRLERELSTGREAFYRRGDAARATPPEPVQAQLRATADTVWARGLALRAGESPQPVRFKRSDLEQLQELGYLDAP